MVVGVVATNEDHRESRGRRLYLGRRQDEGLALLTRLGRGPSPGTRREELRLHQLEFPLELGLLPVSGETIDATSATHPLQPPGDPLSEQVKEKEDLEVTW